MEKFCENCKNEVREDFDFCPFCSAPITERAKDLDDKKAVNAQLVLLANLIKEIEDPKTLYILDKYVKMLSKN